MNSTSFRPITYPFHNTIPLKGKWTTSTLNHCLSNDMMSLTFSGKEKKYYYSEGDTIHAQLSPGQQARFDTHYLKSCSAIWLISKSANGEWINTFAHYNPKDFHRKQKQAFQENVEKHKSSTEHQVLIVTRAGDYEKTEEGKYQRKPLSSRLNSQLNNIIKSNIGANISTNIIGYGVNPQDAGVTFTVRFPEDKTEPVRYEVSGERYGQLEAPH